jgi:hypothetical protein
MNVIRNTDDDRFAIYNSQLVMSSHSIPTVYNNTLASLLSVPVELRLRIHSYLVAPARFYIDEQYQSSNAQK